MQWLLCILLALAVQLYAQGPPPNNKPGKAAGKETGNSGEPESKTGETGKRVELNLLGQTDAAAGESRRNENVQFNLVDNGALKELNIRLGTTATIVSEFTVSNSYFGAEFGNAPRAALTIPGKLDGGTHGALHWLHQNSALSARAFFQVGGVKPARENDYGFTLGAPLWRNAKLFAEGGQDKIRGVVNGNALVPRPDERTPLALDPATRALVAKFLNAYPAELPNRTDINERFLNTNSPQLINGHSGQLRVDQQLNKRDQLALQYVFTAQNVDAFQFVKGQNPNTDTKSHTARLVWTRQWDAALLTHLTVSYERVTSLLEPARDAVGPFVLVAGLSFIGPDGAIPINRAQNSIRTAGLLRRTDGAHNWTAGFTVLRKQLNGSETDVHRGFFSFNNDFLDAQGRPRTAITNLRLGTASQYILATGNIHRGFRNWDWLGYAGDNWRVNPRLNLQYGLRYQPVTTPREVNRLNTLPYPCDCNNLAPSLGLAYRWPKRYGVLRAAYGLHYGEIFAVTFQQARFSPPQNAKVVVTAPDLVNPFGTAAGGAQPTRRTTLYELAPDLVVPYAQQYNLSWEPELSKHFKLQLGYVGSRSQKLFVMWYQNRAHGAPYTTATINDRRPNPNFADIRTVVNGSRGYFDAARVSLILPGWHGLAVDASYWFSKALDLGTSYTNTANENDSRTGRSQSEFENHRDMKGLSAFDQPHALLWRTSYALPALAHRFGARVLNGWKLSSVVLVKTGTPFNISSGSDGPGFGNVDGNGGDRPNLLDPTILGRTIGHPDTAQQLLPRRAFAFIQPQEERGNLGRNVFRKGGIANVNAALARAWAWRRDVRLTLRAESINLFNHAQFAEPGFELANPNFGQITNTLNEGRTFRFGLQLGW